MQQISTSEVIARIKRDNPWWENPDHKIVEAEHPRRVYFDPFTQIAINKKVKRATILMGPRRVGKTFMLKQFVHELIKGGTASTDILYVSIDTPMNRAGFAGGHFL